MCVCVCFNGIIVCILVSIIFASFILSYSKHICEVIIRSIKVQLKGRNINGSHNVEKYDLDILQHLLSHWQE